MEDRKNPMFTDCKLSYDPPVLTFPAKWKPSILYKRNNYIYIKANINTASARIVTRPSCMIEQGVYSLSRLTVVVFSGVMHQ